MPTTEPMPMASLADRMLVVAARERFGDLDEVRDLGQPIAGDDQPQPVASFVQRRRRTLVGERVIDAAARPPLLALLDEA